MILPSSAELAGRHEDHAALELAGVLHRFGDIGFEGWVRSRDLAVERHDVGAFVLLDDPASLHDSGKAAQHLHDLAGMDEEAAHLDRLIGAAQPARDTRFGRAQRIAWSPGFCNNP